MSKVSINRAVKVSLFLVLLAAAVFSRPIISSASAENDSEFTYYAINQSDSFGDQVDTPEALVAVKIREVNSFLWVTLLTPLSPLADCYVDTDKLICSAHRELSQDEQRLVEYSLGPVRSFARANEFRSVARFRESVECDVFRLDEGCEAILNYCSEGADSATAYFGVLVSDRRDANDLGVLVSDFLSTSYVSNENWRKRGTLVRFGSCGTKLPVSWLNPFSV